MTDTASVAKGSVPAVITTYLAMRSQEQLRPKGADARLEVRELKEPNWTFNRDLYRRVGDPWHWFDKHGWTDAQWQEYALAAELRTFAAYYHDALAGYYELRRDDEGGIEIAYFGLRPQVTGRGLGGALLTTAIETAWQMSPHQFACGCTHATTIIHTLSQTIGPAACRSSRSSATANSYSDRNSAVTFADSLRVWR
jgi:GNAT superfamily N-acetyltransferase